MASDVDPEEAEEPSDAATEPSEDGDDGDPPVLDTATSEEYGEYAVDGDGLAFDVFTEDPSGESTCTEGCVEQWPIVSTLDPPDYAGSVDGDLVGTIDRPGTSSDVEQVTYREKPLYLYVQDQEPGEVNGQGVNGSWFLIGPDGVALRGDEVDADS